jgi:NADH-quinone oxidoreductase subunit N
LAKCAAFSAVIDAGTSWAYVLAVVMAVNSVVALAYYAQVARQMWMQPVPDGDKTPVRVPVSLTTALAITVVVTVSFGVVPWATDLGDTASFSAPAEVAPPPAAALPNAP